MRESLRIASKVNELCRNFVRCSVQGVGCRAHGVGCMVYGVGWGVYMRRTWPRLMPNSRRSASDIDATRAHQWGYIYLSFYLSIYLSICLDIYIYIQIQLLQGGGGHAADVATLDAQLEEVRLRHGRHSHPAMGLVKHPEMGLF